VGYYQRLILNSVMDGNVKKSILIMLMITFVFVGCGYKTDPIYKESIIRAQ
jgi:hypothetical protein